MSPKKSPAKKEVKPKTKTKPKKTISKKQTKTSKSKINQEQKQALFSPKIEKITVNIGVGEAGERLNKAETVLQNLTKHKPVETLSKTTNKDWGLRKRMPIGCRVTLRGKDADEFLKDALNTRENKMAEYSFDEEGNLAFGIPDHTLFKTQKYDPNIGIFGMDVCITMKKPGYRIKRRRIAKRHIPQRHRVKKDDTIKFFSKNYNVEVIS
jgi:large subunit ribosomal protein L5